MSDGFESLFDSDFCIDKPIRLIELFGGIGSQAMALRDIGANFEHYRLVEFDKYACASYNAIHGTSFEPTDIRNVHGGDLGIVDKDDWCYLLTYSFPCTDLSVAGKMKGMSKTDWESGKSTRSGLLWEVERILKELPKECLPNILLMENVPQVHAEKNLSDFESWQSFLRGCGYQNFYADLNARDFGIPQNRVRCFMVSILSDEYVDFEFPSTIELEKVMKDFLEEKVDEKCYINNEKAKELIDKLIVDEVLDEDAKTTRGADVVSSIRDSYYKTGERNIRENIVSGKGYEGVIEETKCVGGLSDKKWSDKQYHQQHRVYKGDVALCLPANLPEGSYKYVDRYRIRKLTPREVWRLMGYTDEDFDKAAFRKDIFYLEGDKDKCNAKLKIVREKQKLTNSETYASCTINDFAGMEILKIIKTLLAEMQESEKIQNVDFVITKSERLELSECAINTTKCITFMGMQCILMEEKDQRATVIIVQDEKDKQSIGKSMKIITELNSNPLKLYIILILTAQIMKSGIYGSLTLQANIRGVTTITECYENSILLKISDLRMESISTRSSQSQLYKQAGNAIVKQVLMAIFRQMKPKMREQK